MQSMESALEALIKVGVPEPGRHLMSELLTEHNGEGPKEVLCDVVEMLEEIGLPVSTAQAKRMQAAARDGKATAADFVRMAEELRVRIDDELAAELFLHVPSTRAKYFARPDFDSTVAKAFPDATLDIEEAAKCFALARWTACVFHLMRASEHGLRSLAAFLGVTFDFKNWDPIVKKMRSEVDNYNTSSFKGNLDFLRQSLERLTAVQVALRNEVMHSRSFYDEERAFDIYRAVRGFMKQLAIQLKSTP